MDQDTKYILEAVNFIKDRMLTKDDGATKSNIATLGAEMKEGFRDVRSELQALRRELDELREKSENISGFGKEIDHALERIATIEKHLGIRRKIEA